MRLDPALVARAHADAHAKRWRVSRERFAEALEHSLARGGTDESTPRDVERYVRSLHLDDLALACACADGDEAAWDHFMAEHRPVLYHAADALDPGGSARDLADSLYGELFGLRARDGKRQSLFIYFHGRSSLATWIRAILTQRYVDRLRAQRRTQPLPEAHEEAATVSAPAPDTDPDRPRYLRLISRALRRAVASLSARDRLRLACYYAEEMTLAETGRLLREHEATTSRQLAKSRKAIRRNVEHQLRHEHGLPESEIAQCFESVAGDAGPLDLQHIFSDADRKESTRDRSR